MSRSFTVNLVDDKGRTIADAWARAFRDDTQVEVETRYTDATGRATFTTLPENVDCSILCLWGRQSQYFFSEATIGTTEIDDLAITTDKIAAGAITPKTLLLALQPYSSDIVFLPGNSSNQNKHNAVHWATGHIHFADGTTQDIIAGEITALGDGVTRYIYFIVGNSSLQHTSEYASVVSENTRLLTTVIVSSDPNQEIGILLNQNTSGNFIYDLMAPGAIKSDTLSDFAVAVKKTNLAFHQIY